MNRDIIHAAGRTWGAAMLASALLSAFLLRWLPASVRWDVLWAWVLTGGLSAAGYFLTPHAIGADSTRFLVFGLGSQLLRIGVLVLCITLLTLSENSSSLGFVSAALLGYFVHLFAEIAWLVRRPPTPTATT